MATTLPAAALQARAATLSPVRHALDDGVGGGEDDARAAMRLRADRCSALMRCAETSAFGETRS